MKKYIFLLITALTISMHTASTYSMRLHIHFHITDKQTTRKILKTMWHAGQIAGAIAGAHLATQNIPASLIKKTALVACLIPSVYTLIDCGGTGLYYLYIKKKTMPEAFKDRVKAAVHRW